jgi:hypothetical protein
VPCGMRSLFARGSFEKGKKNIKKFMPRIKLD